MRVFSGEPTMKRATIAGGVLAAVLVLLALAAVYRAGGPQVDRAAAPAPANSPATGEGPDSTAMSEVPDREAAAGAAPRTEGLHQGFLYGRITTTGGARHEGRLRWGGDQEAFWSDYFNGFKDENPWAALVPPERLPVERYPIELFGWVLAHRERPAGLGRPFMARFGEIARIEAVGGDVRVTLKSGTVFNLDRFEASDFDDGVRVWDARGNAVDLDSLQVRSIELIADPGVSGVAAGAGASHRLHGTVRSRQGDFTGFLQWNRKECLGSDDLDGRDERGKRSLRFDALRAIARHSPESALVTLLDGREVVLSGSSEVGEGNLGIYVDDRRYGRVLVSWEAFERVDFSPPSPPGTGPTYGDFPPGHPLTGSVTTRDGRRLAGRLVFDLDESETTETLDAPSQGVDYTLPFGRIAAIALLSGSAKGGAASVAVTLQSGETLELERAGDLGASNAGLLIFVDGGERPEYVPWSDVAQVDFDRTLKVERQPGAL
jgi:hypothetical protein